MSPSIQAWWDTRSQREQRLILAMLGLIALVAAWILVVQPLAGALDAAKTRHALAATALGEARARTPAAGPTAASPPLPIEGHLRRTSQEAGFTGARIVSSGPARATFAIDAARPPAFFAWVAAVERSGVGVESLQARRNPDRTLRIEARFGVSR